jgi:hypothetical protein
MDKAQQFLLVSGMVVLAYFLITNNTTSVLQNNGTLGGNSLDNITGSMVPNSNTNELNYLNTQDMNKLDGQNVSNMNTQQTKIMDGLNNNTCYPKAQLSAQELLPKDTASDWANVNPGGVGSLCDKNFLQAGSMLGIDTIGQTLRNANLQLRSEPLIKQTIVSPWLQSTIQPDVLRRPLEMGGTPN